MSKTDHALDWRPDPATGLSGEQSLLEEFEDHVDDIAQAHQPGIYILELSTPSTTDYEQFERLWRQQFDAVPEYLPSIAQSDKLLYVGAAKSVYERLDEHLSAPNRSTAVASIFPIHSIRYVKWCETVDIAMQRESGVALDLSNNVGNAHVHCR